MAYYLSSYVGSGTRADPFRPSVTDPGWSAIDLRPDGGATPGGGGLNACLLHLPIANADPSLTLIGLDPADVLGTAAVTALNAKLGTSAAPGRLDQIVSSLLMFPPVNGWKGLLPALDMNRYEIWLGGLFWSRSLISGGALPATDNFNRADEDPVSNGGKWTAFGQQAGASLAVVTNKCTGGGTVLDDALIFWNADTFNSDHYSQCVLNAFGTGDSGPMIRAPGGAITDYWWSHSAANTNRIQKVVNDVFTTLKTTNSTFASGNTAKIDASGSSIRVYVNGTQTDSTTDTQLTGGSPGLEGNATDTAENMDDWQGDNVAVDVYIPTARFRVRLRQF